MFISSNSKETSSLRLFYLFQAGQTISRMGSKMTAYGLVLWAYAQTGSVLSVSLLTVCTLAPLFCFSFFFGSLGDRWNRKRIILISDGFAALCSLMALILLGQGKLQITHLYILNFLIGTGDAFQGPAVSAIQSELIPREHYGKTSGIRSFCNSAVDLTSPLAATALYTWMGMTPIILLDLCSFLFAAISLYFWIPIAPPSPKNADKSAWSLLKEGVHYLIGFRPMLLLLIYKASVNFVAALTRNLTVPMILAKTGSEMLSGMISSLTGIATLLGALLVTRVKAPENRIRQMTEVLIISCLPSLAVAFGPGPIWWGFGFCLSAFFVPLWVSHIDVLMRTKVPISMHSRLFAAEETLKQGSLVLGMIFSGLLVDQGMEPWAQSLGQPAGTGMAWMFAVSSVLCIAIALFFGRSKTMNQLEP